MSHRLILTTEATVEGVAPDDIVQSVMDSVDVPAVSPDAESGDGEPIRPVFEAAVPDASARDTDGDRSPEPGE